MAIERPPFQNREQRRRAEKSNRLDPLTNLNIAFQKESEDVRVSNDLWDKENKRLITFPELAFEGQPFINYWMESRKRFSGSIRRGFTFGLKNPELINLDNLYTFSKYDLYGNPINGVSIEQIDKMKLPLDTSNIKTINHLFTAWGVFRKYNPDQITATSSLGFLATVPLSQPDKIKHTPDSIRHLREVSRSYFDYFVSFINNGAASDDDEVNYLMMMNGLQPMLFPILAGYLPARLGITPASAQKLIDENIEFSYLDLKAAWMINGKLMKKYLPPAYPRGVIPANFEKHVHFNPEADKKATQILSSYYKKTSEDDASEKNIKRQTAVNNFQRDIKHRLYSEIKENNDSFTYTNSKGPIKEITALNLYAHSTMFVIALEGGTHLIIEIGQDGKVYGIPPKLYRQVPHIEDELLPLILDIPLAQKEQKHPAVSMHTQEADFVKRSVARGVTSLEVTEPKRKRLFRSTGNIVIEPPISQEPEPLRFIPYSREAILSFLGSRANDNQVEKAENMLYRFERGAMKLDPLHLAKSDTRKLFRLRTGELRIVVEHTGDRHYEVLGIGDRDEIYQKTF